MFVLTGNVPVRSGMDCPLVKVRIKPLRAQRFSALDNRIRHYFGCSGSGRIRPSLPRRYWDGQLRFSGGSGATGKAHVERSVLEEDLLEIVRALEISIALLYFFLFVSWQKISCAILGQQFDNTKVATQLQEILTRLGPTFVKLAQTASMRPDLVGDSYSKSLAKLQDSVKPFDSGQAYSILEEEWDRPIEEIFTSLSHEPIASASMGQVYRGFLKEEYGGKQVAVKVRRPGVYESIKTDIGLLRNTIGVVQKLAGITRDLRVLVDEVGQGLLGECDFRNEVKNSTSFLKAHRSLPFITIPAPVEELCSDKVFVSEWVDGKSPVQLIDNGDARDNPKVLNLVRMGIQCSLSQLLVTGCMHGDPHSGNLLLTSDNQLCYLDFGLLVYVPPSDRQAMMAALVHLGLGDWKRLVNDLNDLKLLKPETDKDMLAQDLEKEFQAVMLEGTVQTGGKDTGNPLNQLPLLSLQTTKLNFSTLVGVLFKLAFKYKFLLPSFFPLVVRSVSSLEGVALAVDPDFKLVAAGMPVVLNQLLSDRRPASQKLLKELLLMPGGDALRADETTRQILQVWLSAAQQANKIDSDDEDEVPSGLSKSTAVDMKNLLLDRRNVPLRRTLIMSNPASTIAAMPQETREQLLDILTEVMISDTAGELASGMLKSTPAARAQRKRLAMLFKASVPKVFDSPPKNIFELIKFTIAVFWAFIKAIYRRIAKNVSSWFHSKDRSRLDSQHHIPKT